MLILIFDKSNLNDRVKQILIMNWIFHLIWHTLGFPSTRSSKLYTGLKETWITKRTINWKRKKRQMHNLPWRFIGIRSHYSLQGGDHFNGITILKIVSEHHNITTQVKDIFWEQQWIVFITKVSHLLHITTWFQLNVDLLNPSNRPWVGTEP